MPEENYAEELLRELREKEDAQKAVDPAAPAVRAAIAELEAPWVLYRSGLEVIRFPEGDPFTPYRVRSRVKACEFRSCSEALWSR